MDRGAELRCALRSLRALLPLLICVGLAACSGERLRDLDPNSIADAVPSDEPLSPYGNPDSYVVDGKRYYTLHTAKGFTERGIASWYGDPFHGRKTSSGEIYDMYRMTAAHKQLPLPTYVQVRNLDNGRLATVKVNDRGPFKDNRIIDLSYAAAIKLGVVANGTAFVEIRALDADGKPSNAPPHETAPSPPSQSSPPPAPVQAPAPALVTNGPSPSAGAKPNAGTAPPAASKPSTSVPLVTAKPTAAAAPSSAQPAINAGMYLQVGAYADRRNAEKVSQQIAAVVTSTVAIREIKSNNKVFYRVQIGPLRSTEVADQVVTALDKLGITQHYFITN